MVSPLISIVIPVYNVERYIERCVDSVLCQTYKNIELLINDGSTDNSGFLCEKLANKDSRIKVFHKINEGLSATRNFGVEQSNGQFVGFVDSDDYIEEDTISGIVKEQFENDTEVEEKLKDKNINVLNVPEFFKQLKEKVDNYYTEKVDG